MIEFNINHQIITRNDVFEVVADSKNYLLAKFTCSDEWEEKVTAIFGWGGKYFNVLIEDGICTVPWEVIKAPFFTVSAVCGDRITANEITVAVEESGYVEGETPEPPTPDVYAQLLNSIKPPYIGENGNWFLWDNDAKTFVDSGVNAKVDAESEVGTAITKAFTEALEEAGKKDVAVLEDAKAYTDKSVFFYKNNFANALKATASGKTVSVDDVSPIEHIVKAVVSSKNLFDINNYTTVGGKLAFDISRLEMGGKYTFSSNTTLASIKISDKPGGYNSVSNYGVATKKLTFKMSRNSNIPEGTTQYLFLGIDSSFITDISQLNGYEIQIEEGDTVTEYEPYVDIVSVTVTVQDGNGGEVATYRPNADGTIDIVSLSPAMTVLTNNELVNIDIEYNQDINAFAKNGGDNSGGGNGLSAYEIALKNGFEGTEQEWLNSLHGKDGNPGYSPVRGTDYWTEEDKNEIKSYINEAFLGGAW